MSRYVRGGFAGKTGRRLTVWGRELDSMRRLKWMRIGVAHRHRKESTSTTIRDGMKHHLAKQLF